MLNRVFKAFTALSCLSLISMLTARPAIAEEPVELAPQTPWNVEWAENHCTLQRVFGPVDSPFSLRLNLYAPADNYEVLMVGKQLRPLHPAIATTLVLDTGMRPPMRISRWQNPVSDNQEPAILLTLERENTQAKRPQAVAVGAEFGRTTRLRLESDGKVIVLNTGPMAQVLNALDTCSIDLVAEWGLDPEIQKSLSRHVKIKGIDPLNYPLNSMRKGSEARVSMHMLIDAEGKPTKCEIAQSYSTKLFEQEVCAKMLGTRFEPALDANGIPVASYFATTISFVLP
ncbi:energy transducer TonB [Novosphingobium clariflavum]|uniref:Energy transducer TonB n=1 Tax=Novosphingobium clariflavum TaxID=2029884 RepID=A0ABV6S8H4_9SPHN|nr:energy transducer TonB [Novosphingobium clariflavum]